MSKTSMSLTTRRLSRCLTLFLACAGSLVYPPSLTAQQGNSDSGNAAAKVEVVKNAFSDDRYRIGPGDLIGVTVFDYPQLSSDAVRVDRRGKILLPMIDGEIQAACLTEGELAKEIARHYLKYLKEPQVRVFVKDYQSQPVAVIGAVNNPGRFQLQRRVRLLELLTFVNGPSDRAGDTIQIIHTEGAPVCGSDEPGASQSGDVDLVTVNLTETMLGIEKANPIAQPGDIITVLDAPQYFVIGNVVRPSSYPIRTRVTITQAIAVAGGLLPDTKTERIRIVRRGSDGVTRTELFVNLKEIAKNDGKEVLIQPNDIIEISRQGGLGMAFKQAFRSILPGMANSLPLRVVY